MHSGPESLGIGACATNMRAMCNPMYFSSHAYVGVGVGVDDWP